MGVKPHKMDERDFVHITGPYIPSVYHWRSIGAREATTTLLPGEVVTCVTAG
jgi:hypothetical protein